MSGTNYAKNMLCALALVLIGGMFFLPSAAMAKDRELLVSAAMSLRSAFEVLAKEYEKITPGVKMVMNYSSSGKLRQQIEAEAPVDVYASASKKHMDILEDSGDIITGSRTNFASNVIVLAVPADGSIESFEDLVSPEVRRIALGNPDTSPAGRYAKETLVNMGIWGKVRDRLVFVETVRQVLDYLARNEVDAGLLYATDAALNPGFVREVMRAPNDTHASIEYPIATISTSRQKDTAAGFVKFVTGPYGRKVLQAKGFVISDE